MASHTPQPSSKTSTARGEGSFSSLTSEPFPTPSLRLKARSCPAQANVQSLKSAASTPPEIADENRRPVASDGLVRNLPSVSSLEKSWNRQQLSKKRSQYYDEAFSCLEPSNSARYRVAKDSVVTAEVKLNCILTSEQSFLGDLSFQLSEIYQRPESSIMVAVLAETPMLLGGSAEPAYHLTISALPSEIAPTKNKRSAVLIQRFMSESLCIASGRGVVRFEPIGEANLATNSRTAQQEIEEAERAPNHDPGARGTINRSRSRRCKKSSISILAELSRSPEPIPNSRSPTRLAQTPGRAGDSNPTGSNCPEKKSMKRRKSVMAFFGMA